MQTLLAWRMALVLGQPFGGSLVVTATSGLCVFYGQHFLVGVVAETGECGKYAASEVVTDRLLCAAPAQRQPEENLNFYSSSFCLKPPFPPAGTVYSSILPLASRTWGALVHTAALRGLWPPVSERQSHCDDAAALAEHSCPLRGR